MRHVYLSLSLLLTAQLMQAQTIKVLPYLQDASPNSIYILWETDSGEESIVEWGVSGMLGNTTVGAVFNSEGDSRIHEVKLEGLDRFTKYFYRVRTAAATSEVYSFKTPPFATDEESFRIVAMSDMQRDNNQPDKFAEIIQEGIIDYLTLESGLDLTDQLALVMIPGDLVVTGTNYASWENQFFAPSQQLFSHIPVYPVPGNHEQNAIHYFRYFKLPDNGTIGFEEHWYYKDYGNVRIIGLDSNSPFTNQEQLNWLDAVLESSCEATEIDFVFAQLHHPFKSELWTPGESNYTGEVVGRLEQFSTDCGKPSIHFFGHTHGYSRGQSRDHKHLWINAATAGGAIDNWGEFPNFDYDEFSRSQDEYGFVSVEITAGDDPSVTVKRIGRGDQDEIRDNELRDSLYFRRYPSEVSTPEGLYPVNIELAPECVILEASSFQSSVAGLEHGQSHWQVASVESGFGDPVAESWKNFENWYYEIDTQDGDDLTDEKILGLAENSSYWWRVRYRDKELNWSGWSTPVLFDTGNSNTSPNLLLNPGAESDLDNWTIDEGVVEALTDGICDGISPFSGIQYFGVGGICEHSIVGRASQEVDVSGFTDSIDAGGFSANFGGYLSNFGGQDLPEMNLIFLDENGVELATSASISTLNSNWTLLSQWEAIPALTRTIRVALKGTRNAGTDNDSYFDELFLRLGNSSIDCSGITGINNLANSMGERLTISPNPFESNAVINLPDASYQQLRLFVVDASGKKMKCTSSIGQSSINLNRGNLPAGNYFFWVNDNGRTIGNGRFMVR